MKICVLGATGAIGSRAVQLAVAGGHEVTAYVRSPEKLSFRDPRLCVVQGDLFDSARLAQVLDGHDAALSTFGKRQDAAQPVNEAFTRSLVTAMKTAKVERLVYVSVAFLFRNSILATVFGSLFFRKEVKDHAAGERILIDSPLAWTIVRPPGFTDSKKTKVRVRQNGLPLLGFTIGRDALADFLVKEIPDGRHVRAILGVAN